MIYQSDKPILGISEKVAREVSRGWKTRKHNVYWQPFVDKCRLMVFSKDPLLRKLGNYST